MNAVDYKVAWVPLDVLTEALAAQGLHVVSDAEMSEKDEWTKRLEDKLLQVAITAEMWACGECSPEFALRSIRREVGAVAKRLAEGALPK